MQEKTLMIGMALTLLKRLIPLKIN